MFTFSKEIQDLVRDDLKQYSQASGETIERLVPLMLDEARFDKMLLELLANVRGLEKGRMLEVGCGYGAMVLFGHRKYNLDLYGLEPSKQGYFGRYEIAQKLFSENGLSGERIRSGVGENMPFEDRSFDVVFSYQVLEHVQDPFRVLAESWRVLKPGGVLYINAPNFRTFFEGHYNIPWIPGQPKALAKVYVRLFGKQPNLIDELNFLTQPLLNSWLVRACGKEIESDFGVGDWMTRMQQVTIDRYTKPELHALVNFGKRTGMLRFIAQLGKMLKLQDTLRVAVRKDADS